MWLFTNRGFYSIVKDYENPGNVLVRARLRGDLENLREAWPSLGDTRETNRRDYRFRASLSEAEVPALAAKLASEIDYTNFKNSVYEKQGREREDLYHDVWHVMSSAQDKEFDADCIRQNRRG